MGPRRALAFAWLAVFAVALVWLGLRLPSARLETSIFELVPWKAPDPASLIGADALRAQVEGSLQVLVGAKDPAVAARAADAYAAALSGTAGIESVSCAVPSGAVAATLSFFARHRWNLLCSADRAMLATRPEAFLTRSLQELYLPPGLGGFLGFSRDPFGTFDRWLEDRAAVTGGLSLADGHLEARDHGLTWVAVGAKLTSGSDARSGSAMEGGLRRAAAAARAGGAEKLLRAGFFLQERAAAAQARREVGEVGLLSTGVLALLLWVAFRRPIPMALALLPAAVGCVAGAAAVLLFWNRVHVVALVFGSTVVGVADDYGLYFLSGIYDGAWDSARRYRDSRAPLALAMATSALGYAVLCVLPIPALRQVAAFAVVGLAVDLAGVLLWYPALTRSLELVPASFSAAAGSLRRSWPRWGNNPATWCLVVILGVCAAGWPRLRVDDDVRRLYAHDPGLDSEQAKVQAITGLGGASGFFVVQGPDPQTLLIREEALRDVLTAAGASRWQAVSALVPSLRRQEADHRALGEVLFGPRHLARRLAFELGQPSLEVGLRKDFERGSTPLTPESWLKNAASAPFRRLWLPQADGSVESLVLPGPGLGQADFARLRPLALGLPGVHAVDQVQSATMQLAEMRRLLDWFLVGACAVVVLLLALRLGWAAPAAAMPTVFGVGASLGVLGWSGLSVNLFVPLGLLLLVGTAVDFGIYTQDLGGRLSSFVAVQVAALTNIAAVGVLCFSGTPALRTFGLVLSVGIVAAWLSAPYFEPRGADPGSAKLAEEKVRKESVRGRGRGRAAE